MMAEKRCQKLWIVAAFAAMILAFPGISSAQQGQRIAVSEILSRIDRLESDVGTILRSRVQIGEDGRIRLDQMEQELRRLSSLIDRLAFDQRQAIARAEQRAVDFEIRLEALERRPPSVSIAQQSVPNVQASPVPPTSNQPQLPVDVAPQIVRGNAGNAPRTLPPPQYARAPQVQPTVPQRPRPPVTFRPIPTAPALSAPVGFDAPPDLSALPGGDPQLALNDGSQPRVQDLQTNAPIDIAIAPAPPVQPSFIPPPEPIQQAPVQQPPIQQRPARPVLVQPPTQSPPISPVPSAPASQPSPINAVATDLYSQGVQFLNQGQFTEAGEVFERIVAEHPQDPASGQAKFWLGDMHLRLGRFDVAAKSFLESFREWPEGPKAPDSLLKLGITLANLGQRDEACLTFTQFRPRFPDAPEQLLRRADLEARRAQCGG